MIKNKILKIILCSFVLFSGIIFTAFSEGGITLSPSKAGHVFTDSEPVVYSLGIQSEIPYTVTDYFGNVVVNSVGTNDGTISICGLPIGHYRLNASQECAEFAVVKSPENRRNNDNSPLAADYASVFLVGENDIDMYARAVYLAGIKQVRERFRWSVCNSQSGVFDYSAHDKYYNPLSRYGIKIHSVFHNAPKFTINDNKLLCDDLSAAYEFAKNSAKHYDGIVDSWEVWNEPDIDFTHSTETADRYGALLGAMYIGYMDSGADVKVSLSGIAYEPGKYLNQLMSCDVSRYFDTYNYHVHKTYNQSASSQPYPENYRAHNSFIWEQGISDKNVWVSEAGMFIPYTDGTDKLNFDYQRIQARYLATSAVEGLSRGEDKHFWFIIPNYSENNRNLGSFSPDKMPYASYSALSAATEALGNACYEGKIKGLPENVNGYAFIDGDESVAAIWSSEKVSCEIICGSERAEITDIMGNSEDATCMGGVLGLTASEDIQYVRIKGQFPDLLIEKDIKNEKSQSKPLGANERIVINQTYPEDLRNDAKNSGYKLNKNTKTIICADIYNMNNTRLAARITPMTYGGWSISPKITNIVLEPFEKRTMSFTITSDGSPTNLLLYPVVISGETAYGKISKSVSYITSDESTAVKTDDFDTQWMDNLLWGNNAPLGTVQTIKSDNNALTMSFDFPNTVTDRWAYPIFKLAKSKDFCQYDGLAITLECNDNAVRSKFRVFLNEDSAEYYTAVGYDLTGEKQQIIIPWEDFSLRNGEGAEAVLSPDSITSIRVGLNAASAGVSAISIEDLGVYSLGGEKLNGSVELMEYDNGTINGKLSVSEIPYDFSSAKITVLGVDYPVIFNDLDFSADIPLPIGNYEALFTITNASGAVIKQRCSFSAIIHGLRGEKLKITGANEEEIYSVLNAGLIYSSALVENVTDERKKIEIAQAVYGDDGALTDVTFSKWEILPGESKTIKTQIQAKSADTVKVFVWNDEQQPLYNSLLIN